LKELKKLADSLEKLISDCSPPSWKREKEEREKKEEGSGLSYRQIWSLLKMILQKYMKLKLEVESQGGQNSSDSALIQNLLTHLKLDHKSQIGNQVYQLLITQELAGRVVYKVKKLLK
jgi:hypothetical protein